MKKKFRNPSNFSAFRKLDTSPEIEHQIHEVPENIVSFKGREIDEMADEDKNNNNDIDAEIDEMAEEDNNNNIEIDEMADEDNTNNNDINADDENYSFEQEEEGDGGGDTYLNSYDVSEGLFTFLGTYYILSLLDNAPNDLVGCIINRENRLFSVENTYNVADNDEGPSSDDLYYEEEEYDKGESPSVEIENDYQGGDGLLTFSSLLDNVPNYLVGCVIQKRYQLFIIIIISFRQ